MLNTEKNELVIDLHGLRAHAGKEITFYVITNILFHFYWWVPAKRNILQNVKIFNKGPLMG